ncbi:hypothetical protein QAD02_016321 [Eretmocerus hayati]|uniref:Uncharacterized protein n=1 Tax=Eretmocerus hayati TaxID=131215 RepID=A0ACC2PB58_9HYME|nr:hypothetical protein QAD02_016321 [Eretmocerus hayati]
MALNPAYEAIANGFVQQYYAMFDDPIQRPNLVNMYNVDSSFMTFQGKQAQGSAKIMESIKALTFQKINRIISSIDAQPTFDGGVLINVLGRLQADEDPVHDFFQIFVLKPLGNSFFCQHDIFRLAIHDTA